MGDFKKIEHVFERQLIAVFQKDIPSIFDVRLTQYGVSGSYQLPNFITFEIDSKDGIQTLFHEMIHLMIESDVQTYGVKQWEKERTVDLILHSEPFAFLEYQKWQRNYHGVEKIVDPLFHELFFTDIHQFFKQVSSKK